MAYEIDTASNHVDLLARLRRFITGRAILTTPVKTGTGNGVMSAVDSYPVAVTETWTITCTVAAANGGTFSVVGSVSGAQTSATVGTAYDNGIVKFLISDGSADFIVGDNFVFSATRGAMSVEGTPWELLRSDSTTLMVKGKGLAGTEEIYVNFKIFENIPSDIYNFVCQGAAGYVGASAVDNQPGQSPKVGLTLWNAPMKYWFIVNGRRVIIVAKVSTYYIAGYFGLILPYGTPQQYPYPLFIGANMPNNSDATNSNYNTSNYSLNSGVNSNYWSPRCASNNHPSEYNAQTDVTQSMLYWVDGSWQDFTQFSSSLNYHTSVPTNVNVVLPINNNWIRDNVDGTYELTPHQLAIVTPANALAGELDGSFFVSGFSNGSENIINVGADSYVVVQNVFRNGVADFAAIKLA